MKFSIKKTLFKSVIAFLLILYILPLYIAVSNAFKNYESIIKKPLSLPFPPILDNFQRAFKEVEIFTLYGNSIIITVLSLFAIMLLASTMSYVFARSPKKQYKILYIIVLTGMMIPVQNILIPSIKTLQFLKLIGTLPGLILFYCGTYVSMAVFLYTEFMRTIPVSLEESAEIDGASPFRIYFQIIFPLLRSCTASVVIFLGMWIWNDFLPPMYILGAARGRTITTGIYGAIGTYTTDWSLVFACVILASAPIVILYLLLQKQFQSGITAGSVKQ
ncbi:MULTISPECIES: carbohydrate ABC transporter permease [unclassified Oceanispirochaeta]|uniref:carbohydrate ABC transporter permease n=1 Tax=unclassified Oceanispirochaeta TaxID=2635722 RepID=UPI000E09D685|nr:MULTISPECIES: carbohydrate ABC transporter permease [unclassified Oceanispirochaeta]MBF9016566.1 carbohydrate ABC transporter permease [Oceanispirochaeta sp. M2]NPD73029.1 carbohydrate ABC transporter permease [Oceanispirochaeta sp. M1]RDG31377.1 carbohydrate ABC transporter permease [Oceanispirochaeta sp. M1]